MKALIDFLLASSCSCSDVMDLYAESNTRISNGRHRHPPNTSSLASSTTCTPLQFSVCSPNSSLRDTHLSVSTEYLGISLTQVICACVTTDPQKPTDLEVTNFEPKRFTDDDVEIAITHCGVCGSDVHTLKQGWGDSKLPLVVGHEIVGHARRIGQNVKDIKPGDRVGVGAKIGGCLSCRQCNSGYENYCPKGISTYVSICEQICRIHLLTLKDRHLRRHVLQNSQYPDGIVTQGGYATAIRAKQRFVFPIPDALESRYACSMLCGGLTVFSPLKTNGAGPGKRVGVIGIGGLGHYAILFAKALGAEVFAFTHSHDKMEDAKKLGADHVVDTNNKVIAFARSIMPSVSTMDFY